MNNEILETVEHSTGSPVSGSVIWLHGLGADGHDFEPIVPELRIGHGSLRFVFPHAPVQPVTLNGGIPMRAWFDVIALGRGAQQDERGIREAETRVRALIRRENERGVTTGKIVLAGFSQGGAIALHTGLRYPERLAGMIALSTYLPLAWTVDAEAHQANARAAVLMAHGSFDPLVSPDLGSETRDFLQQRNYPVEWQTYPMANEVCAEEVARTREWLSKIFSADS